MAVVVPSGKLQLRRGVAAKRRPPCGACWRGLCAALAAFSCAGVGVAAEPEAAPRAVVVSSTLERIAAAAGTAGDEVQPAADTVASHADQLIVSVRFTNTSPQVVDGLRITSPVPADVRYVAGSASGPGSTVLFSADNGRTFGRPAELTLALPDGGTRLADAADYTHVRWILEAPLAAGAAGVARYRAVPR
jgi:hypothetical protein